LVSRQAIGGATALLPSVFTCTGEEYESLSDFLFAVNDANGRELRKRLWKALRAGKYASSMAMAPRAFIGLKPRTSLALKSDRSTWVY